MTHALERRLPASWLELNVWALEFLLGAALVLGTVSALATATGDPEAMATVALIGAAVLLLGLTAVRISDRVRTDGIPLAA